MSVEISPTTITQAAKPGVWSALGHLAVPAGLTTLKALPSKFERYLQKKYKEGVEGPQLTTEDIAGAKAATEAITREARALEARGSASGGRSGLDQDRARLARKAALDRLAKLLSGARAGRLKKYATDVAAHSKLGDTLGALDLKRKEGLFADIEKHATDKDLAKHFKALGERLRTKDTSKYKEDIELKGE